MDIVAAVLEPGSRVFSVEPVELGEPRSDEVLVRVAGCGVCHTDVVVRDDWYDVPRPVVLGHEGAGVVVKVGSAVTSVRVGDHVVMHLLSCGECLQCMHGRYGYCERLFPQNFGARRLDGSTPLQRRGHQVSGRFFGQSAFASYAIANQRNVVRVPHDLPLELLAPLGCGVITGAGAVLNALQPEVGTSIAIFGAGTVGLSGIMAARARGCTQVIAVDVHPSRLWLARELGATDTINAGEADLSEEIASLTGAGPQYSLDTTGNPRVIRTAVDTLAVRGVCALVGAVRIGAEGVFDLSSILLGRTVRGVIAGDCVPAELIPRLVELHRQGRFPFDRLVRTYPLSDINQAFADCESGEIVKAVLVP